MKVRPATKDDLTAIAELFGSVEEAVHGRPSRLDAEAVAGWMATLCFETNSWLLEEDEALAAAAFGQLYGRRGVFAGAVRPAAQGRGLGTQLVELVEERLGGEGAERLHGWSVGGDAAADDLFTARGYRQVRRFWDMAVELEGDVPAPDVEVAAFREVDAPAFHGALEEAFADHWEHHPEPFEEWWSRQQERSAYDPGLWFLVRDREEVAAVIRSDLHRLGGGFVGALGVRPAWRGRGYGRALLLHTFREFRRRGLSRAALVVDSANATGATRLYESVGMHVELENLVWEKASPRGS